MKRAGRKSSAQTPAPPQERIKGSKKNPKGSAKSKSSASDIELSESIIKVLKDKVEKHNLEYPSKKVNLATLKAVFRRGSGAYSSSHRPTITGGRPNTRTAWSYARVNKFLQKKAGKEVKKAYVQDDDLLAEGGYLTDKGGLYIIIQGVREENKYKGAYKKIFDIIEEGVSYYNPYGTVYEEIKGKDFHIVITPKPDLFVTDKIKKIPKVKIVDQYAEGGEVEQMIKNGIVELKMYATTNEHSDLYGFQSKNPLYIQSILVKKEHRLNGIGRKVMEYIIDYAKRNGHDVVFGHITQKAEPSIEVIKSILTKSGFNVIEGNNDFYKLINPDVRYKQGGDLPVGKLARGMSLSEVAAKHGLKAEDLKQELELGIKTEKEHTDREDIARAIALDHLFEDPKYYTNLIKMESQLRKYAKGGEIDPDDKKIKESITHKSGEAGGLLVGRRHSEGGIKAINKSTGQNLEMEGGEVVITRDAVSDDTKREFEGEMLTNREILSRINEGGGGVAFAKGGDVPHKCACSGKEYRFGGNLLKDNLIVNMIMDGNKRILGLKYPHLPNSQAFKKMYEDKFGKGGALFDKSGYVLIMDKAIPSLITFSKMNEDILSHGMKRAYIEFLKSEYKIYFEDLPHMIQAALLLGNQKLVDKYLDK